MSQVTLDGTRVISYTYDIQGQLTGADDTGRSGCERYTYDAGGNMTERRYYAGHESDDLFQTTYTSRTLTYSSQSNNRRCRSNRFRCCRARKDFCRSGCVRRRFAI